MRVVVTGASGQLGSYLVARLRERGVDVDAWSGRASGERAGVALRPIDLADADAVERRLKAFDPAVLVHAAAISSAEGVRRDPERAWAVNVEATARLAEWCARAGRKLVFTSTDMVFDGGRSFSREDDRPSPVSLYGRSKAEAEPSVLDAPGGLVVRSCLLFGPSRAGRPTYLDETFEALRRGEARTFFADEFRTPLDLETAAEALARLAASRAEGIVHLGGVERMSRFDLIRRAAGALGLDVGLIRSNRQADATFPEPRPADVSLDTSRLAALLPDLRRPSVEEAARRLWGAD